VPEEDAKGKRRRGFAAMTPEKQREIAKLGGAAAHARGVAHRFSADEARAAGRKGGQSVSQDRDHMSSIGRKGGETVSRDREHMSDIGREGGHSRGRRGDKKGRGGTRRSA
jgi:general stress protein YciG